MLYNGYLHFLKVILFCQNEDYSQKLYSKLSKLFIDSQKLYDMSKDSLCSLNY